jgi:hypothetical protein
MNYDIGPFSTGSTQKVTWVSFGEFHVSTGKRAHDKTHPVHSVLCRTNVRVFYTYVLHILKLSVPAEDNHTHKFQRFAGMQEKILMTHGFKCA